jgi:hypothetical protein
MNYKNFTPDQKESFWIIAILLIFAAITFVGGGSLILISPVISVLLFICGLSLTALAGTGIYVEFIEKPRDDNKYSNWYQD